MNNKIPSYIVRNGVTVGLNSNITLISTAPIGTVLSFAGSTAPYGFLICNGQEVSRTDYSDLYKVIGTTYGEGDGETTFNVPNLVDKFIQGSTISGTEKEAGLPNIEGSITKTTTGTGDNFLADNTASGLSINGALSIKQYKTVKSMANGEESYSSPASIDFDASKSNAIYGNSDTVQPPALTMVYIIKAFHTNEGMDKIENPIRTTLDIALAENDCDNIPNLISDMTTVVSTVSSDIVAHTPKDTFATETGFFEITTTRQNSTYAWQTAKRLGGKPNVFQRCMLDGVWEQWRSVGVVRDDLMNDINTWSSSKIASEIGAKITKTQYRGSQSIDINTGGKLTFIYSSEYASQAGCYMLLSNFNTEPLLIELGRNNIGQFSVTVTHKSQNVDTITVTTAGDEYSWYVLQL